MLVFQGCGQIRKGSRFPAFYFPHKMHIWSFMQKIHYLLKVTIETLEQGVKYVQS